MRSLLAAIGAGVVLAACSQPSVAKCSRSSDCPRDAICVTGICQKGVPSGGSAAAASGAATLSSGTVTLDVQVGAFAPQGSSGTKTLTPAENTR